jgi:predicted RNA-binding protein
MCLNDGPFRLITPTEEINLDDISSILIGNGEVKLVDQFGKINTVNGTISEVDLMNQRIVLE